MNLNQKSSDLKLYSRGKYSNGLPYTSDDIHQEQDLALRKLGIIMDSITGSSILEDVTFDTLSDNDYLNIRLSSIVPVNLNGEIFLIGNSPTVYPLSIPNDFTGSIVLVCWYSSITTQSTLYEYGGLCNNTMVNDILDTNLNIQTSSRYQMRWNIGYCTNNFNYAKPEVQEIRLLNPIITESGRKTNLIINKSNMKINGKFYTCNSTDDIPSEDGFFHVIPIGLVHEGLISPIKAPLSLNGIESTVEPSTDSKVWYNPTTEEVKMFFDGRWRNIASSSGGAIITQEDEPSGFYPEGTLWYRPSTKEFSIYLEGIGFVGTHAEIGFVQLQGTYVFDTEITPSQDIEISIPIEDYTPSDLMRVSYEGLELIPNVNYTLNSEQKTIKLLGFTAHVGEILVFTETRVVGTSELNTTILTLLDSHKGTSASETKFGHVKLSDIPTVNYDQTKGVAATPASVKSIDTKLSNSINDLGNRLDSVTNDLESEMIDLSVKISEAKLFVDPSTSKTYELGVLNGLLYIRERVGD